MKKEIYSVFIICAIMQQSFSQNTGININSPTQVLDINGKIKIRDDGQSPSAGTIRYNSVSQDFEGYNGIGWNTFINKGIEVGYFEQSTFFTSTLRNVNVVFPDSIIVSQTGYYLTFFGGEMSGLHDNTVGLSSDVSWRLQLFVDRPSIDFVADEIFTSAGLDALGSGSSAYSFRRQERVYGMRALFLQAGEKLFLRYQVNSDPGNPAPVTLYNIFKSEIYIIKINL